MTTTAEMNHHEGAPMTTDPTAAQPTTPDVLAVARKFLHASGLTASDLRAAVDTLEGTTDPTTAPAAPDQLDLDAIEARAEAATPGPWGTVDDGSLMAPYVSVACDDGPIITCPECHTAGGGRRADAKFIAAARTDVPALVAEVRRLRDMLDLPDGIRWDLARWRCTRCAATGTWTGDDDPAAVDPVAAAADEARRHAADHERWDAEREARRQATPPSDAWTCPVPGHTAVERDDDETRCLAPGCLRTSSDPPGGRKSCECGLYVCDGGCCGPGQCSCSALPAGTGGERDA